MDFIEVMDTTLRDGEQFAGGLFTSSDKCRIVEFLLKEVQVDRVEVASARVRPEKESFEKIMQWAHSNDFVDKIEVLGFVDGHQSVDWISQAGGRILNLLAKGSERHCTVHLRKTLQQHLGDIEQTVAYAEEKGLRVQLYLEDWSQGMKQSEYYVKEMIQFVRQFPIRRLMLADTLGILQPEEVFCFVQKVIQWWEGPLDFHGHNDYGLATANTLAAVKAGVGTVHVTVNGHGERAGNTPLDEAVVVIHDHAGKKTRVNEHKLREISRLVAICSERKIPENKPISGAHVFVGTAGIHADGDRKGDLYKTRLHPNRFGVDYSYSLGKLSGRASIVNNLEKLHMTLAPHQVDAIVERVVDEGGA